MLRFNLLIVFSTVFFSIYSQTSAQQLEKAILLYEEFQDYTSSDATDLEIVEQEIIYEDALKLLKEVQTSGTVEEFKVANYFELLLNFEYGVSSLFIGDYESAFEDFQKIEPKILSYKESDFPLKYSKENKNYIIEWKHFASNQSEFFSMLVETSFNLYKQDDLVNYFNKYRNSAKRTENLDYVVYNLLIQSIDPSGMFGDLLKSIQSIGGNEPIFSNLEMTEFALIALKSYHGFTSERKEELKSKGVNSMEQGLTTLLKYVDNTNKTSCSNLAEGYYLVALNSPNQINLLRAANYCFENYSNIQLRVNELDFLRKSIEIAKLYTEKNYDSAKAIGLKATKYLDKFIATSNCELYSEIASNYNYWKETSLGNEYLVKYSNCKEDQIKLAKKNARVAKRANSNLNIYAGVYVLPLIAYNDKRDYGGVLNISRNKLSYEFSYLKIQNKKENVFDLWIREVDGISQKDFSLWSGSYSHFQLKYHEDEEAPYVGFLAGYAYKNFDSYTSNVINNTTSVSTIESFNPEVKQFIGMINIGMMQLRKGVGIDAYYGFGFNYSKYNNGTTIDRTTSTIQNPSLQNRKDTYFGFIMRFGLTFGLNFGSGN
jgi:hypothetical protein